MVATSGHIPSAPVLSQAIKRVTPVCEGDRHTSLGITRKVRNPSDHRAIQLMGGGFPDSRSNDWMDSGNIKNSSLQSLSMAASTRNIEH